MLGRRLQLFFASTALIAGSAGCAHSDQDQLESPDEAQLSRLRSENRRLRSKVELLEEENRLLKGGEGEAGDVRGEDGRRAGLAPRDLPVVKLAPPDNAPEHRGEHVRPRNATSLGDLPNSGYDGDPHAQAGWTSTPTPHEGGVPPQGAGVGTAPQGGTSGEGTTSYRLVGSELVQATRTVKPPEQTEAPTPESHGKDPVVVAYEQARELYVAEQWKAAEVAFADLVRRHPQHAYADNALYWQGEASYDQENYSDALTAFTEVVERYGGGNKAPDALLKIGLCYGKLGDLANARDVLQQLIEAYPRARASKIAKKKLKELGG